MIGTDNVIGGSVESDPTRGDSKEGTALAEKIDLFGVGTGYAPTNSSTNSDDYKIFIDWGNNKIGNDIPNTWRSLEIEEWYYLRYTRANADELCGVAQVNGVNGLILLPDDWTCPSGITFKSGHHTIVGIDYYATYQTFSADQWLQLEKHGAVFLPASGYREATNIFRVQDCGGYWAVPGNDSPSGAAVLYFDSSSSSVAAVNRFQGLGVRLVKDL